MKHNLGASIWGLYQKHILCGRKLHKDVDMRKLSAESNFIPTTLFSHYLTLNLCVENLSRSMFLYLHSNSQLMKNLQWKLPYNFAVLYTEKVSSGVLHVIHTESGMIFRPLDLQLASTTSLWKIVRFLLTNSVHTPFYVHGIYNHINNESSC